MQDRDRVILLFIEDIRPLELKREDGDEQLNCDFTAEFGVHEAEFEIGNSEEIIVEFSGECYKLETVFVPVQAQGFGSGRKISSNGSKNERRSKQCDKPTGK